MHEWAAGPVRPPRRGRVGRARFREQQPGEREDSVLDTLHGVSLTTETDTGNVTQFTHVIGIQDP